ncbi:permease [Bacillus horti]|uniref:Uncharacterized membrane protein YraQ (UPF0718 family) n=1 Tax=Caldalkalibacillus horti TaxID=77523 RepID=A0ABT9W4E6_9BACI|nr:permease [Bacillus horti]MDQ0168106.1 uncharacterized membrane protein YraQ (UPF0718 family) [Bacillus horti]
MKPLYEKEGKSSFLKGIGPDFIGISLLALFLLLFFNRDALKGGDLFFFVSDSFLSVNTIFLSIVIEAIPFILLGVFFSALIQIFVHEDMIKRFLPKNAFVALLPATLLGAIFPVCECAIIPVVRRLIKKGMPLHVGVVFLVAAPILNPVVFASTFFAFRTDMTVVYSRMIVAFILAIIIGGILYILYKNSNQIRESKATPHTHIHVHSGHDSQQVSEKSFTQKSIQKLKQTMYHATDEFFDMGKYLIVGAFIAALFQTYLDRQILLSIGSDDVSAPLVMMLFAYVLSLCSEADAFVAASFGSTFSTGSIVAFLVYGPMIDLKNTIMYFAYFKKGFVISFIITVTITVFLAVMVLQWFFI